MISRHAALLVAFALFLLSLWIRAWPPGVLDGPADQSWRSMTGLSMMALEHWLAQPFPFDWALVFTPRAPDGFEYVYSSYPPGFLLPPYILAKLLPFIPLPTLFRCIGIAFHFFFAAVSGWICARLTASRACGLAGYALTLFSAPLLLFYGNAWFADFYVLVPWALSLALELRRRRTGAELPRWEPLLFFFGFLGEWLFWIYALALFLLRRQGGDRRLARFAAPAIAALFLHLLPLWRHGELAALGSRLAARTGASLGYADIVRRFFSEFWFGLVPQYAGITWLPAFGLLLTALWLVRRRVDFPFALLLIIPPFVHAALLVGHYFAHSYPVAKFALPFSVLACGLLPSALPTAYRARAAAACALLFLPLQTFAYARLTPLIVGTPEKYENLCRFVRAKAHPDEEWFSSAEVVEPFRVEDLEETFRHIPLCGRYVYPAESRRAAESTLRDWRARNPGYHPSTAVLVRHTPSGFLVERWSTP